MLATKTVSLLPAMYARESDIASPIVVLRSTKNAIAK